MLHAIKWKMRFDEEGLPSPRDRWRPEDYDARILETATEEYDVDKLTNTFLRLTCTGEGGRPFEFHKALVSSGWDYLEAAIGMLDGMRAFLAQTVASFQIGRVDIQSLNDQAFSYITDVVTVAAHCAATRNDLEGWAADERRLMRSDGYQRFLSDAWPAIHAFWRLPSDSDDDQFKTAREGAVSAVGTIYRRCGLQLTPTADGATYINTSFPPTLRP